MHDAACAPLRKFERWGLYLLPLALVIFGGLVEMRSAFLSRRMGDLGCYLRGAWAVRAGTDLYDITDDNQWHYNYPPFFAIMLVPLADPPAGQTGPYLVPYKVSVALFYLGNIFFLFWGVHALAGSLEKYGPGLGWRTQPRYCRRWWALRLWPFWVCIAPIGHTLMRGQVNLMILAMLIAMIVCFLREQSFRAGMWLALASAIKLIPVFLIVYPLVRRDGRCLMGLLVGWLATLVVIPLLALGPAKTLTNYQHFADTLLGPAFRLGNDRSREKELLGASTTDNQSLKHALFNTWYPNASTRPEHLEAWAEWTYRLLALVLTGLTLAAGFRAKFQPGWPLVLFLGAMMYLMTILGPVCHLHYFTSLVPLMMALLAAHWELRSQLWLGWGLLGVLGLFLLATVLPLIPILEPVRALGLPLYAGLILWGWSVCRLWKAVPEPQINSADLILERKSWHLQAMNISPT